MNQLEAEYKKTLKDLSTTIKLNEKEELIFENGFWRGVMAKGKVDKK